MLLIKVFLTKKAFNALKSPKHEEATFPREFIFVLSRISLVRHRQKNSFRKKDKGGIGHIGSCS